MKGSITLAYLKTNNLFRRLFILAELGKSKLSLAVTFSSVTGYFLYRNSVDLSFISLAAGVFLLASGAAVLNQYTEREEDAGMERTRTRPIPSKRISPGQAIVFLMFLLIAGSCLLLSAGIIPFILGMLCVVLYNFVYTSLKKITVLAIVPGALVGAIPPVIGFATAGGDIFNYRIVLFSVFMFLWQLPHFWLLLIRYAKEYQTAGFKTIVKYLDEKQLRYLVFFWVLLSSLFLLLFVLIINEINNYLAGSLIVFNLVFILLFYRLLFPKRISWDSMSAFILLNSFGFLLMIVLIADSLLKSI